MACRPGKENLACGCGNNGATARPSARTQWSRMIPLKLDWIKSNMSAADINPVYGGLGCRMFSLLRCSTQPPHPVPTLAADASKRTVQELLFSGSGWCSCLLQPCTHLWLMRAIPPSWCCSANAVIERLVSSCDNIENNKHNGGAIGVGIGRCFCMQGL